MNVCPALITALAHSVAGPVRFGLEPGRLYLFDAMTQQALGMMWHSARRPRRIPAGRGAFGNGRACCWSLIKCWWV
jgi:hypothetical protein